MKYLLISFLMAASIFSATSLDALSDFRFDPSFFKSEQFSCDEIKFIVDQANEYVAQDGVEFKHECLVVEPQKSHLWGAVKSGGAWAHRILVNDIPYCWVKDGKLFKDAVVYSNLVEFDPSVNVGVGHHKAEFFYSLISSRMKIALGGTYGFSSLYNMQLPSCYFQSLDDRTKKAIEEYGQQIVD